MQDKKQNDMNQTTPDKSRTQDPSKNKQVDQGRDRDSDIRK